MAVGGVLWQVDTADRRGMGRLMDYTSKGITNEWYTPDYIFKALNIVYDLDPCALEHHVDIPVFRWCKAFISSNGLEAQWKGCVFMNPPWSGRPNTIAPWLDKFTRHGDGIVIFPSRTSCGWFHDYVPLLDMILFPRGKTKFISGSGISSNPMAGIVLGAIGDRATTALSESNLGIYSRPMIYTDR